MKGHYVKHTFVNYQKNQIVKLHYILYITIKAASKLFINYFSLFTIYNKNNYTHIIYTKTFIICIHYTLCRHASSLRQNGS